MVSNRSFFSVAMCVYSGDIAEHFEVAVESVLNQTIQPDELVLVVDGPINDKVNDVIGKYESNSKFKMVRFSENQGHAKARQAALEACTYNIVALMDSDDISVPTRFEKELEILRKNPEISVVGSNIQEFEDEPQCVVGYRVVPESDVDIKEYMKKRCPMNQVTVLIKKDDVLDAGGFLDWYCNEDYYLWIRLAAKGYRFANVQEPLVNVRVDSKMYGRRGGFKYFTSEAKLQAYMLSSGIIGLPRFVINVCERFVVQMLMTNKLRMWFFQNIARVKGSTE